MTTPIVTRGRAYHGPEAFTVNAPEDHRFIPGRAVMVIPAHEEAPGWRAILAGYTSEGRAVVVPLEGHFGELIVKALSANGGLCLTLDKPSERDECDREAARALALSTAHTFNLTSRA